MKKANSLFALGVVALLSFVTGCDEEFPITEGILGDRSDEPDDVGDVESLDELPDALGFDGTFDGATDTATPSSDDDFRYLGEAAYVVWSMERLLQQMDRIVARVGDDQQFENEQLWTEGFTAENCGNSDDMTLETAGRDGSLEFDETCLELMARTDGRTIELDGELLWENLRSNEETAFGNAPITTRTLLLDELGVRWRDETFTVTAISELQEDEDQLAIVVDVNHNASNQSFRLVSRRLPGEIATAERRLFLDERGVLTQSQLSSQWVTAVTDGCDADVGAGDGAMVLAASDDDDSAARLEMTLFPCDVYNLSQLQDGDGQVPGGGDLTDNELFEVLWE